MLELEKLEVGSVLEYQLKDSYNINPVKVIVLDVVKDDKGRVICVIDMTANDTNDPYISKWNLDLHKWYTEGHRMVLR